jgi:hypothetical protein
MSASSCSTGIANYAPAVLHFNCIPQGFSPRFTIEFLDEDGADLDISGDTFSMPTFKPDGTAGPILTVGDGLSIDDDHVLSGLIDDEITDTLGKHTFRIIWSVSATDEVMPAVQGSINIVAVGASCASNSCSSSSALRIRVGGNITLRVNRSGGGLTSPREQTITTGGTVTIPAGKRFMGIGIAGASGTRTVSVGTSAAGTQLFDTEIITSGMDTDLNTSRYFPDGATLHFTLSAPIDARVYIW